MIHEFAVDPYAMIEIAKEQFLTSLFCKTIGLGHGSAKVFSEVCEYQIWREEIRKNEEINVEVKKVKINSTCPTALT